MTSEKAFDQLEQTLELFIENIRQVGIIVGDFQPQGQPQLNQKIQSVIGGLQEIDKQRQAVQDVKIPLEVFEYIDDARNPQLYTKDCMEKALTCNEEVKGKIEVLRKFKSVLMGELGREFPHEMAKYRALRGGSGSAPNSDGAMGGDL